MGVATELGLGLGLAAAGDGDLATSELLEAPMPQALTHMSNAARQASLRILER